MDKPTCRLCGAKHWASEAHEFEKPTRGTSSASPAADSSGGPSKATGRRRKTAKSTTATDAAPAGSSEKKTGGSELERLRAIVEKRKTYMREYMRKRRSKT